MERLKQWCDDINRVQKEFIYEYIFVDQESYQKYKPKSFEQLVNGFLEYKD